MPVVFGWFAVDLMCKEVKGSGALVSASDLTFEYGWANPVIL